MVKWILTALALFGVGRGANAPAPKDTNSATTAPSPTANPSQPVQPACSDGRNIPPPPC
jgi:hypothetical protein